MFHVIQGEHFLALLQQAHRKYVVLQNEYLWNNGWEWNKVWYVVVMNGSCQGI
jgi:hypothetical protein